MNNVYMGIGIKTETGEIIFLSFGEDESQCRIDTKEKAKETKCEDSEVFNTMDKIEKLRSDILWWLSDNGIPRLEGQEILKLIGSKMKEVFK